MPWSLSRALGSSSGSAGQCPGPSLLPESSGPSKFVLHRQSTTGRPSRGATWSCRPDSPASSPPCLAPSPFQHLSATVWRPSVPLWLSVSAGAARPSSLHLIGAYVPFRLFSSQWPLKPPSRGVLRCCVPCAPCTAAPGPLTGRDGASRGRGRGGRPSLGLLISAGRAPLGTAPRPSRAPAEVWLGHPHGRCAQPTQGCLPSGRSALAQARWPQVFSDCFIVLYPSMDGQVKV